MTPLRRTAFVAGLLYLVTFVAGIPPSFLYAPVLTDPSAVLTAGNDGQILWGVFLDLCTGMAGIGTAVALFSVVKRQHEGAAIGFVTTRLIEGAMLFIVGLSMLTLVSLPQAAAGASDPATLTAIGQTLVDLRNGAYLMGPGLMPAFNACLLGYLMYRSGLVPRWMPTLGLIGAPLLFLSSLGTLFGVNDRDVGLDRYWTIPIFIWELSIQLGHRTFKGFRPPAQRLSRRAAARSLSRGQDGRSRSLIAVLLARTG